MGQDAPKSFQSSRASSSAGTMASLLDIAYALGPIQTNTSDFIVILKFHAHLTAHQVRTLCKRCFPTGAFPARVGTFGFGLTAGRGPGRVLNGVGGISARDPA